MVLIYFQETEFNREEELGKLQVTADLGTQSSTRVARPITKMF